ncbi:ribosome biogenesis GTPase Der [Desulfothermus sp.]
MLPVVAIIGRTNVGKSTLFNRLIRTNKAIIHDREGVTRDRIYGEVKYTKKPFALFDTGGLTFNFEDEIDKSIFDQVEDAIDDACLILFLVDGKAGLTPLDEEIAEFIRRAKKPVLLVVNKIDGKELADTLVSDFHALGFELIPISAAHGYNVPYLIEKIQKIIPEPTIEPNVSGLRIALVGRPNVGKSSMINAFVGEKRLIESPIAGTTRDSVDVVLKKDGAQYIFVDTAGVRRKSKIKDPLEKFSVLRALSASKRANITVLVVEATSKLTHQDKTLIHFLQKENIPLILAVNKIDMVPREKLEAVRTYFKDQLKFCPYVPIVFTSTVDRRGLGGILVLAEKLWSETNKRITTGELNRGLELAIKRHQPPVVKNKRPKFYYLTQVDITPPTFVFFMNDHTLLKTPYKRYLENQIRKIFGFKMAPIKLFFRTSRDKRENKK